MAVTPSIKDKNRNAEIARMKKIAKGPDGKEKIQSEFGIDLEKGPLPGEGKPVVPEVGNKNQNKPKQ